MQTLTTYYTNPEGKHIEITRKITLHSTQSAEPGWVAVFWRKNKDGSSSYRHEPVVIWAVYWELHESTDKWMGPYVSGMSPDVSGFLNENEHFECFERVNDDYPYTPSWKVVSA